MILQLLRYAFSKALNGNVTRNIKKMKIHRLKALMLVSLCVVGAVISLNIGQAPTINKDRIVAGQTLILASRLIVIYHFFTTRFTTYGASAIQKRVYICN